MSSVGATFASRRGVPTVKPGMSRESGTSARSLPAVACSAENPEEAVFSRKARLELTFEMGI